MLPFFPSPYPDELLYSICARYHQRSGHTSQSYTMLDFFGNRQAAAVVDFPTRIGSLVQHLSRQTLHTVTRLINSHTLFPLYRPFLPIDRAERLSSLMGSKTHTGNVHMAIGQTASGIPSVKFLRYCRSCLQIDEQNYGEPYWHRSHQVSGVRFCHIHHELLLDSVVAFGGVCASHAFVPLGPEVFGSRQPLLKIQGLSHHFWLADAVHWLLNESQDKKPPGLEELRRRYLCHLQRQALASSGRCLNGRKLVERFCKYYGENFLAELHCGLAVASSDNWLLTLVRKQREASHPLRHLLLIRFLNLEIEEFLEEEINQPHPFGRGPWPCLNPAASHFRRAVIGDCVVSRNSETGAPVGTFICKCGFIYSRSGPDRSRADRSRIGRIVTVGPVWEERLLQLVLTEKRSFRETARQLEVDVKTVQRHLELLVNAPDGEPTPLPPSNSELYFYRSNWLELCTANPGKGVKALRQIRCADYAWLYRHDRIWLQTHTPERCSRTPPNGRVDWRERDTHMATRIDLVAMAIRQLSGRLERVTVSNILKRLGVLAALSKKLDRMPLTRAALESVVETKEEFAIRRLRFATEKLRKLEEPLVAWKLVRMAGLRPGFSDSVAKELMRLLDESEKGKYGANRDKEVAVS